MIRNITRPRTTSLSDLRYKTTASTNQFNDKNSNSSSSYGMITSLIKKGLCKKNEMKEELELDQAKIVFDKINNMISSCDPGSLTFNSGSQEKSCSLNEVLEYIRESKKTFQAKDICDLLTKIEKEIAKLISHEHRSMKAERIEKGLPLTTKTEKGDIPLAPPAFLKS